MPSPKSQTCLKSQISRVGNLSPFVICHLSFVILAFLVRLFPLGYYVTPDEPAWVYRAIRFADGLMARDWTAIPATGHPGVTTMWLGAAGVTVQRWLDPSGSVAHLDWIRHLAWLAPTNGDAFHHLAFFLPWGRVAVALVTTLGLAVLYPLLVRLFDRRAALLTVGLLALDPFLTGHSGLLHTDALLATFSLLALATALCGLREPRRAAWWVLSGLFTGLALLTKTPAIILPPFILLLLAIAALRKPQTCHSSFVIRHSSLFILSTMITVLALYPALWANPADTLHTLSAFAGRHVEMVQRPIFFAGQMTYDPGPAFYPVVFIFRISPVVLVGLVIGLVTLRRLPHDRRFAFLLLLAFALGFGALMSLGAKKHDRYLLPAFPPLALAAALGWEYLSRRVMSRRVMSRRVDEYPTSSTHPSFPHSSFTHLLIPIIIQLTLTLPFTPHPLTAFNPLAGGPWGAARVLPVDWGEGAGAAARWLNQLPNAGQLTAATSSIPSFAPLFNGRTIPLDQATLADYLILPHSHTPTPPYPTAHTINLDPLALLRREKPGFSEKTWFLHAAVLTNTAPFEQAAYLTAHVRSDDLILLDANGPLLRHYTGPGALTSVADLPDQAAVAARLAELSTGRSRLWLVADPAAPPITVAHLRQELEAIADPVSTATVASTTVSQYVIRNNVIRNNVIQNARYASFNEQLVLIDALLPARPLNAAFPVFLRWQVPASTPSDAHASLHLRDATGHLWAEVGQPVLNAVHFATSAWAPGEWADSAVKLKLPPRIPPGDYAVQLTVTDSEGADSGGAQLGAWDGDGQFQGVHVHLGDVEIEPPTDPVGPAPCAEGHTVAAGPLLACVPALPPQAVPSGDVLTLALTWSAAAPPEADYCVRWRLLDISGSLVSVALEQIAPLSPYATSHWRAGDSFEARYDLRFDPGLAAAQYTLMLNVLAPDACGECNRTSHPLWAEDEALTTVEILPRDRLFELPSDIAHPLDLALGDTVHLRGFDLPGERTLQPGDTLPLTLYWQAGGPSDVDYTVFVHLVGPDGHTHGQVDQFPAGGAAPTTSWAYGQVIVDEIILPVAADAPAGTYHIAVGMYDAASGGRPPITNGSGQSLPDEQAILPVEITVVGGQP